MTPLFGLFGEPKYRHPKAKVRLKAVQRIQDQRLVCELLETERDADVQHCLIGKIADHRRLVDIARTCPKDENLQYMILGALSDPDLLREAFLEQISPSERQIDLMVRRAALWPTDPRWLGEIMGKLGKLSERRFASLCDGLRDKGLILAFALGTYLAKDDLLLRNLAAERVFFRDELRRLVLEADHPAIAVKAASRIKDAAWFAQVMKPTMHPWLLSVMAECLTDRDLLTRLAQDRSYPDKVRFVAYRQLGVTSSSSLPADYLALVLEVARNSDDRAFIESCVGGLTVRDPSFWRRFIQAFRQNPLCKPGACPPDSVLTRAFRELAGDPEALQQVCRQDPACWPYALPLLSRKNVEELLASNGVPVPLVNNARRAIGLPEIENRFCPRCQVVVQAEMIQSKVTEDVPGHNSDDDRDGWIPASLAGYEIYRCPVCGSRCRRDYETGGRAGKGKETFRLLGTSAL